MVRIDKEINTKDHAEVLAKGIRCVKYMNVRSMLRVIRSARIAAKLSECLNRGEGPVYHINFGGYKIVVCSGHAHAIGVDDKNETERVVNELEKALQCNTGSMDNKLWNLEAYTKVVHYEEARL